MFGIASVLTRSPDALSLSQQEVLLSLVLATRSDRASEEGTRIPTGTGAPGERWFFSIKQKEPHLLSLHLRRLGTGSARGSNKTFSKRGLFLSVYKRRIREDVLAKRGSGFFNKPWCVLRTLQGKRNRTRRPQ